MNLTEAFMERNDLKEGIKELKAYMRKNIYTEKGMVEAESLLPKLKELEAAMFKLMMLNIRIHRANNDTVPVLKKIEMLTERIEMMKEWKSTLIEMPKTQRNLYRKLESDDPFILLNHNLEIDFLDAQIKDLTKDKRSCEKDLARLNGMTEV